MNDQDRDFLLGLIVAGFRSALQSETNQIILKQGEFFMALQDNVSAQSSKIDELMAAYSSEKTEVTDALTKLSQTASEQQVTIGNQQITIDDLLTQVKSGQVSIDEASAAIEANTTKIVEAISGVQSIYTPVDSSEPQFPPQEPTARRF